MSSTPSDPKDPSSENHGPVFIPGSTGPTLSTEESVHAAAAAASSSGGGGGRRRGRMNPLALVLGLSAAFFAIFVAISFSFMNRGGGSRGAGGAGSIFGEGAVGIVELNGAIMDSRAVLERLEDFKESGNVKAVVLRMNSPGGSVAPSQEIYEAVKKFPKPVVVSMGSVAASGAYYIACGAKKVYANAGTITGSIGVIMEFANLEKLYEWAKIRRFSIKTGKFKDVGAEYREMSEEERQVLQGMVDNVLGQFKSAVIEGRKLGPDAVDAVATGRIFSGEQAKELKLVDEIGTLDDAIEEAGKMAGIKGKPRVVRIEKKPKLLDMLIEHQTGSDEESRSSDGILSRAFARLLGVREEAVSMRPAGIYFLWSGSL